MTRWRTSLALVARRTCAAVLVSLSLAWSLALPLRTLAQEAPPDVADVRGLTLPPAPDGFVHVQRGSVRWEMPERARGLVEPLFETWDRALPRVTRELGVEGALPPIRIRVGVDPEQMEALAPEGAPPPAYAVGVAYPGLSLILLTLTAPETWQRPELHEVLVHEMSHLALHAALADDRGLVSNDAPLWLVEGVAIYQARERSIERVQTLWEAAFRGGVIELDDLDQRFPSRPHAVSLAYAESADFVAWLLRRSGPEKLGDMLGRMRRGQHFETAVSQTWSLGIGSLELEWREDLSQRFGALPMFATGSVGWVAAGILVVLAWRRRKDKVREIEERWQEEDARAERIAIAHARQRARMLAIERARRLAEAGISASDEIDPARGEPPRTASSGGTFVTSIASVTREEPATVFVVGSTAAREEPPSRASGSVQDARDGFDDDVNRGERSLH